MTNNTVHFQLFGSPQIKLNEKMITFSFTKVNALLYYLIVNKTISRDEIAGLLWPDKTEKSARKNLRNTIYQANKVLGEDFILSPNNKTLELNAALNIVSDIDKFHDENDVEALSVYNDIFLKGFYIKDSEEFDLWISKMRTYYEQLFVQRCYNRIQEDIKTNQLEHVEERIKRLIAIDEFDERNYQLLMQFYQDTNRNSKVIEVYYELVDLLERELDISPSKETRLIYNRTLQMQNKTQRATRTAKKNVFFGRYIELNALEESIVKLFDGTHQHVVLEGNAGVGKSTLTNAVLQRLVQPCFMVKVVCHQSEYHYNLRPIRRLMDELEELAVQEGITTKPFWHSIVNPIFTKLTTDKIIFKATNQIEAVLLEVIQKLQAIRPIIIFMEDIHWIDEESSRLINRLLLNLNKMQVQFLFTVRGHYDSNVARLLNSLSLNQLSKTLVIPPFSKKDVQNYLIKCLGEKQVTCQLVDTIFEKSEGLPFYVGEYTNLAQKNVSLNRLTLKMQEFLKEEFGLFGDIQLEILTTLSYFRHFATVDIIQQITDYDIEIVEETIQAAINQGLVYETLKNNTAYLYFVHRKYKEYLYFKQTYTKKRMFHKKIALILEKMKTKNMSWVLFDDISYHFEQAHLKLRAVSYQLEKVEIALTIQHEIFPLYHAVQWTGETLEDDEVQADLDTIRTTMAQFDASMKQTDEYKLLEMKYLLLKGKFLIRRGEYVEGITFIQKVIIHSEWHDESKYLFEAYRQMIYYFIQIENAQQLKVYVQMAMKLAVQSNNYEQMGMLLRIEGVYYLMMGDYAQAEKQLHESIHIYSITDELFKKYQSNIAAAYDYLAEIARYKKNLKEALAWHNKAILLCEQQSLESSGVVFYLNRGITYYAMEEYRQALKDFEKSKSLLSTVSPLWKKTQLDAYYALCQAEMGMYAPMIEFIREKQTDAESSNPRDEGIVAFVKVKWLSDFWYKAGAENAVQLDRTKEDYMVVAQKHLSRYRDTSLLDKLLI